MKQYFFSARILYRQAAAPLHSASGILKAEDAHDAYEQAMGKLTENSHYRHVKNSIDYVFEVTALNNVE